MNDEERRAEQRKYGVFFDDDYDYLQHLKETTGPSELIPSSTFSVPNRRDENEETSVSPGRFFNNFKCERLWGVCGKKPPFLNQCNCLGQEIM